MGTGRAGAAPGMTTVGRGLSAGARHGVPTAVRGVFIYETRRGRDMWLPSAGLPQWPWGILQFFDPQERVVSGPAMVHLFFSILFFFTFQYPCILCEPFVSSIKLALLLWSNMIISVFLLRKSVIFI